jgi:hypothetical protein
VVYGMPKAAIERGYAMRVIGLEGMGAALQATCGRGPGSNTGSNISAGNMGSAGNIGSAGRATRAGN